MSELDYHAAGVDYNVLDTFKRACQQHAQGTDGSLKSYGFGQVPAIRGESAYLFEAGDAYWAHVEEALGTKILVADRMYELTGRSFYRNSAIDDVSTIVNDLVSCGALPVSVAMYAAVGDAAYLADERRANDLAEGFAEGCRLSGAVWGGGETQALPGMIMPGTMILGGSAVGRIAPKSLRIIGDVHEGDVIIGLASSGLQTNGLTLCRAVADRLSEVYLTRMSDGQSFGEALLEPSVIYAGFIAACQRQGIKLHYAVHMTGHGWRKLMRLDAGLVYRVEHVPQPQPVFNAIVEAAQMSPSAAYGTFNMGVGYAVYVAAEDAQGCLAAAEGAGYKAFRMGHICREGDRKAVIIEPLGIAYESDSLKIR